MSKLSKTRHGTNSRRHSSHDFVMGQHNANLRMARSYLKTSTRVCVPFFWSSLLVEITAKQVTVETRVKSKCVSAWRSIWIQWYESRKNRFLRFSELELFTWNLMFMLITVYGKMISFVEIKIKQLTKWTNIYLK